MNCPKCNYDFQYGNFCSNCGTQLREKCSECGKMERIGRPVCETVLVEAENLRHEHVWKHFYGDFFPHVLLIVVFIVFVCWSCSGYFSLFHDFGMGRLAGLIFVIVVIAIIVGMLFLWSVMEWKFWRQKEKKLLKEFSKKFPTEAEILRKEEEETQS